MSKANGDRARGTVAVAKLLRSPSAYIMSQKLMGADRLRLRCLDEVDLRPHDTVIDIGCGPPYYLDRMPEPLNYHGFDTEETYIAWARKRHGDRANFHLGTFDEASASRLGPADVILLLGVLHHVADDDAHRLLDLVARSLRPGGSAVAVDTCFFEGQGRLSRWFGEHDRGAYVRTNTAFDLLGRSHFGTVSGELLPDTTRLPGAYWLMRMSNG